MFSARLHLGNGNRSSVVQASGLPVSRSLRIRDLGGVEPPRLG